MLNINLLCQFNHTGVGRHAENIFFALSRVRPAGVTVTYVDSSKPALVGRMFAGARAERDATILFWRTEPGFIANLRGTRILWQHFESDRLPKPWIDQMAAFDQIWLPSEWGRSVALSHGLAADRLRVVPAGVNERIFKPRPIAHEGFVFLSVGKYEKRKSIDEVVEAYRDEFPADQYPNVQLWLKADFPMFPERVQQLEAKLVDDRRIRVVSGVISDFDLAALYNQADAFVFPSKAEGFGLPCIEAIACGVPVLATRYSGQTVFLDRIEGCFIPIDFAISPIDDADYRYFYGAQYGAEPFGNWAVPSVAAVRRAMRTVFEDRAGWRDRALRASAMIRESFAWDSIARHALAQMSGRRQEVETLANHT